METDFLLYNSLINLFSSDPEQPIIFEMTFLAAYKEKLSRLHVFQLVKIIIFYFEKPWHLF